MCASASLHYRSRMGRGSHDGANARATQMRPSFKRDSVMVPVLVAVFLVRTVTLQTKLCRQKQLNRNTALNSNLSLKNRTETRKGFSRHTETRGLTRAHGGPCGLKGTHVLRARVTCAVHLYRSVPSLLLVNSSGTSDTNIHQLFLHHAGSRAI